MKHSVLEKITPVQAIVKDSEQTDASPARKKIRIVRVRSKHKGTQTEQPPSRIAYLKNNLFLRTVMRIGYPLVLLGRRNPQKEMVETSYANFYVKEVLKEMFVDNGSQARKMYHELLDCNKVLCIVPGDGINPRTAGIFAGTTEWQVLSIDPDMGGRELMENKKPVDVSEIINKKYNINWPNLKCIRGLAEDIDFSQYTYKMVIFVNVHSHSNFEAAYNLFDCNKLGYTMPCCKHIKSTLYGDQHTSDLSLEGSVSDVCYTGPNKYYVYKSIQDMSFV